MIPPVVLFDGFCIECGEPNTSHADGRQRPFCHKCEQKTLEKLAQTKTGKKMAKGKLYFPPTNSEREY